MGGLQSEVPAVGLLLLGLALTKGLSTHRAGLAIAAGALVVIGGLFVSQTVVAGIGSAILLAGTLSLAGRLARNQ